MTIALQDYQWEIGGLLLGADTPYTVENFEGWGAEYRINDAPRPLEYGEYFGTDFLDAKTRTLTVSIIGDTPEGVSAFRQALVRAWYVDARTPYVTKPMRWKLPGENTTWVNGRPRRSSYTIDQMKYGLIKATLEYRQNDPLEYDDYVASMALNPTETYTTGLGFPLVFPLTFSSSIGSSDSTVIHVANNTGPVPTRPWMTLSGPVTNPRIENQTTGDYISLNITLDETQYLEINFVDKTILLNGVTSRYATLMPGSSWWTLDPGINDISYITQSNDTRALMTLYWRNARL